jgi:Skp family chaperone for outer membrane proteins
MKVDRVLIIVSICLNFIVSAQKPQKVGYIDMNYILENVPEYVNAQSQLDAKVKTWQQKLDALTKEIEQLKTELSNEKSLLTKELIIEREEDIVIKEQELMRLQQAYFGPTGDLFQLRKQFAKPVQDQVYNAIQDIAKKKKYDFVLDKSSDLILLYSNSKFDISELVLNTIVKNRKRQAVADLKLDRMAKAAVVPAANATALESEDEDDVDGTAVEQEADNADEFVNEPIEEAKTEEQKKLEERIQKREELKQRIKEQQEARARMRDSLKIVAEEKRAAKLKEIEDRKKERQEAIDNKN